MWIFSKYGFYSVVKVSERRNPDEEYMIRARNKEQIEKLKKVMQIEKPVVVTRNADYAYRLVVTEEEYKRFIEVMEQSVDYTNFKSACARASKNHKWIECLHDIWNVMFDFQLFERN